MRMLQASFSHPKYSLTIMVCMLCFWKRSGPEKYRRRHRYARL